MHYDSHCECLRDAVTALAHRLANTITPWKDIQAFVSNHLVALDKCPGIRPIGIRESLRHSVGKAICYATCDDLTVLCGSNQLRTYVVVLTVEEKELFMLWLICSGRIVLCHWARPYF